MLFMWELCLFHLKLLWLFHFNPTPFKDSSAVDRDAESPDATPTIPQRFHYPFSFVSAQLTNPKGDGKNHFFSEIILENEI